MRTTLVLLRGGSALRWLRRPRRRAAAAQRHLPGAGRMVQLAATEFEKATGIKVAMTLKGSGESFAQIAAEKANPKLDVWFGGTGDPHLQAAEQDLTDAYKSPLLDAAAAVGAEAGRAIEVPDRRHLPRRARHRLQHRAAGEEESGRARVLEGPRQARIRGRSADGQSECIGHRVHGDRDARAGVRRGARRSSMLKALHKNISNYRARASVRSRRPRAARTWSRVAFIHDVVTEAQAGFPVKSVAPCEGTGYEIGSLSIVKGARNLDNAKKFYDWALTPKAQALGAQTQAIPAAVERRTRRCRRCRRSPPTSSSSTTTSRSTARSAERKRLLERWDKEVGGRRTAPSSQGGMLLRRSSLLLFACRGRCPARKARSTSIAARPIPRGARAWRSASRRRRGVKVSVIQKATGEMLAQIKAEARESEGRHLVGRPGGRVSAGGRGRPSRHLPFAQPRSLHDWAQRISEVSKDRVSGVYGGILSLGYNTELMDKRKLPVPKCWKDLLNPALTRTR